MENLTTQLATYWGLFFTTWAIILIFSPKTNRALIALLLNKGLRISVGVILLLTGVFCMYNHFGWSNILNTILSIIALGSILVGLMVLVYPNIFNLARSIDQSNFLPFIILFTLFLGIYLLNASMGFFNFLID